MTKKAVFRLLDGNPLNETSDEKMQGIQWKSYDSGGILLVHRMKGTEVTVLE